MLGYITKKNNDGDETVAKRLEQYEKYGYTSENPLQDILTNSIYAISHYFGESLDKTSQMLNWTWDKISTTIENYLNKKVMWVVRCDVPCATCKALNGKVFKIRKVPPKHPRCHCGLTTVDDSAPETFIYPGNNPTISPGKDFEWRGQNPIGGEFGAWYNPITKVSLYPDLQHALPKGPHWDNTVKGEPTWSIFEDGRIEIEK